MMAVRYASVVAYKQILLWYHSAFEHRRSIQLPPRGDRKRESLSVDMTGDHMRIEMVRAAVVFTLNKYGLSDRSKHRYKGE
jgi:hypothetical protein